jgi:CMP/dCMP kinase
MSTITISRQLGSQGLKVARLAAEKLGFRLVWREAINQAAQRAGAPEMALSMIDDLGLFDICPSPEMCAAYHQAVRVVIQDLAAAGRVIIVGRAGQVILRDWPSVLHVRIIAPSEIRAANLMAVHHIPHDAALAQIQTSDRRRKKYVKDYYGEKWDDPELYDLIINTGRLSIEAAGELIFQGLSQKSNSRAKISGHV